MKKLIYKIVGHTAVYNPETGKLEQQLSPAEVTVENPTDEEIAKAAKIACNGEYILNDDGEETTSAPTQEERIAKLEKLLGRVRSAFEKIGITIE